MPDSIERDLRSQWANPGDILSLLLLVGGDIVNKAIAQLTGYTIEPHGKNPLCIGLTPVAFSFGWVAYGFTNLLSAVGEQKLMPIIDCPSIVVNCANSFIRSNQSWVLGRLLRDHETRIKHNQRSSLEGKSAREHSIRIDIFELGVSSSLELDLVWWLGWGTITIQICIALIPWVLDSNWGVFMVTLSGNLLALITCALPQWRYEKWAGKILKREKVTCLTRGNGHLHLMVFIGHPGTLDFEELATGTVIPRLETPVISLILALLWGGLLLSVSGLKKQAWYLVGIGGIGMLQNVYAAGTTRRPKASNFDLKEFSRMPTIIGKRQRFEDDKDCDVNFQTATKDVSELSEWLEASHTKMPKWLETMEGKDGVPSWLQPRGHNTDEIINVHGALIELEKWVPTAGLAMLKTYFPGNLEYEDGNIRDNINKKFWRRANHTKSIRMRAERKRREFKRSYTKKEVV